MSPLLMNTSKDACMNMKGGEGNQSTEAGRGGNEDEEEVSHIDGSNHHHAGGEDNDYDDDRSDTQQHDYDPQYTEERIGTAERTEMDPHIVMFEKKTMMMSKTYSMIDYDDFDDDKLSSVHRREDGQSGKNRDGSSHRDA